ncbi:polysaccharide biosynthesis protein [Methanocaldococcus vulcanius M7]|uniref:Polysaccharide biosynthesis protein n=1 Tax=Methanocaldococcus vulcanius (strain ATCC 700851 / DSM 12094 / M7) TaxID=579137 RepID=C9RFB2_METVM|nr:oligosaccharide flippase family protein [Methanocaldococcus vulcanius]ACX72264.1 polysaccharide biosynthesis protein [Methanocaldococcus vulcanius M7]
MEQKLAKHGIIMIFFSLSTAFFNYLYQLFMGRLLIPEEYGILFSLINIFYIFSVLSATVQTTVTKYSSQLKAKNQFSKISYFWRYALKKSFIFGLITTILFFIITPLLSNYLHFPSQMPALILFSSILFAYAMPTNQGILRGLQRFIPLGITQTLWSFLKFILGVLLVYFGFGVSGALVPFLIANIIIFLISFYFLKDLIKINPEPFRITNLYKYSTLTLLALLTYTTSFSIDTILAKHYLTDFLAGIYSSVSVLGKIILFAPGGIAVVLFPKASELKEKGLNHFNLFIKALILTIVLTIPALLLFKLFPELTIKIIFGEKYLKAIPYLFRYSLAMFFFAISGLMMNYLLSLGITRVAYALTFSLAIEILGIIIFHQNINQIVDIVLLSSIMSLIVQVPFIIEVRGRLCT